MEIKAPYKTPERTPKPKWLRVKLPTGKKYTDLRGLVDKYNLNTICTSGSCPNMGECWGAGTATFMILDEFKKLRRFLSENGKTEIIYMGSDIFKPEADITTVILNYIKSEKQKGKLTLYEYRDDSPVVITEKEQWNGEIVLFSTEYSKRIERLCSYKLGDVYDIRISPRTPEIKHNPYVMTSPPNIKDKDILPILNGRNLKIGYVTYDSITGYWIHRDKKTLLRKFFDHPHIVVGLGFRGDAQVGAAFDYKAYPWMGDVYHLLRKHTLTNMDFDLQDEEVVEYLNSELVKRYVKDVFKEITYHFSITQLKILPLPTRGELELLKKEFQDEERLEN